MKKVGGLFRSPKIILRIPYLTSPGSVDQMDTDFKIPPQLDLPKVLRLE